MIGPVADDGVEDGADFGVDADLGVEGVDEGADLGFGNFLFGVHGGTPVVKFIAAIEIFTVTAALRAAYRPENRYDAIGRVGCIDSPLNGAAIEGHGGTPWQRTKRSTFWG